MTGRRRKRASFVCPVIHRLVVLAVFLLVLRLSQAAALPTESPAEEPVNSGCLTCHQGIENIRQPGSKMWERILAKGREQGDPAGCIVCHGGDPTAATKETAHGGDAFYPDPGSPWINEHTCGQCHPDQVRVQWSSLMMSEAGKIQGVCWSFGALQLAHGAASAYESLWGNYAYTNPTNAAERLGTPVYHEYMTRLMKAEPQVFVDRLERLPDAPTNLAEVVKSPELAAFTYLRNQCQRCHLAVRGRQVRGDYRGMGCSACHLPYSNEGLYEGGDPTIPRDQPGHLLVHTIQGTREAKVTVHDTTYSGIPVETCTTCHDRGKRIGVSFQGLMETAYTSPFDAHGDPQPALHTKHYLAMQQDVHYQKGMLCQDCHSSIDVHGDGFLATANLAAVEIECTDCHGTPEAYPWELPIGYGDEIADLPVNAPPRGTAKARPAPTTQGTTYPIRDGYLLSARGNPLGNVVRDGNEIVVHTAAGRDLTLHPLKALTEANHLSLPARVAMVQVRKHVLKTECYACHSSWVPQCYGCHVRIDYSGGKTSFDWLGAGERHSSCARFGANRGEADYPNDIPGQVGEQRSYLRWEEPALGVNGERRVTPVAPGCQPAYTVIGPDGQVLMQNRLYRTPPNTEGAGPEGQLAADMSPTTPHTVTGRARSCESCHASPKALGYGIDQGRSLRPWNEPVVVDLETADKKILPRQYRVQRAATPGLTNDWSRFVTEDGRQLMTVGHHLKHSRPLNNAERANIDRGGICLSCHQEIPDQSLAVNLLNHVAQYAGVTPHTPAAHSRLIHKLLLLAGWAQVLGLAAVPLLGGWWFVRRRRQRAAAR